MDYGIWGNLPWRPRYSNHSRIHSAENCYLCDRNIPQPMSPGRTPRSYGAPGEIRTHDPMLRRHVLYPSELRARGGHSISLKECLSAANALTSVFYPV